MHALKLFYLGTYICVVICALYGNVAFKILAGVFVFVAPFCSKRATGDAGQWSII